MEKPLTSRYKGLLTANDPWSTAFDPTMIWGPVHGALGYIGIRMNFGNKL